MITVDPEITDIETRAEEAKVPMGHVLADADVAATTWWRWRHGKAEPRLSTLRKVRSALDARIEKSQPEGAAAA